jgi:predicted patatin/cPLA2 family phospholipase
MKCSWGAGGFFALAQELAFISPDILICASGSAGTGAYYTAGQYDKIPIIWKEKLVSKKMVNPLRFWKIMDIDYLIDDVFKKQERLKTEKVKSSTIDLEIPALDKETGLFRYFSNSDDVDIFEVLRATKAIPFIYKANPHIEIMNHFYIDSVLTSFWQTHFKKAVELGAEKILVFDHSPFSDLYKASSKGVTGCWFKMQNKKFRQNFMNKVREVLEYEVPANVEILRVRPAQIKNKRIDNSAETLKKNFEQGYRQVANNLEIKKFLGV